MAIHPGFTDTQLPFILVPFFEGRKYVNNSRGSKAAKINAGNAGFVSGTKKKQYGYCAPLIKTLPKEVLLQAAKKLGLSHKKSIAVETGQSLDILFNHVVFHHLHNNKKP